MNIILPIFVCVVLPVSIVLILVYSKVNSTNKQAQVLQKAIECDHGLDVDKLAEVITNRRLFTQQKREKTPRELLHLRLLRGCIFTLGGLFFGITTSVTFHLGKYTMYDDLNGALAVSAISLAIGISYLIVYFMTRKDIDKE